MLLRLLTLLLLWTSSTGAIAAQLSDHIHAPDLTAAVTFFEDPEQSTSLPELISTERPFTALPQNSSRFGFSRSTLWLKLTLHNDTAQSSWWLEVGDPRLQLIQLYQLPTNGTSTGLPTP